MRTGCILPQFAWRASARSQSTRPSGPGASTKSPRRKPGRMVHANRRHPATVRLAGLGPLTVDPALRAWRFHKKPPAEAGGDGSREPAASCHSSLGGPPPAHSRPGPPGLALPQKAPGGSRGTPGRMPSQVPCAVGLNARNCVSSSGMDGGVVFMPGVPGFPPGASWTGNGTDSQFKGSICKTTFASGFLQRRWLPASGRRARHEAAVRRARA
jgi:hypothetical protein